MKYKVEVNMITGVNGHSFRKGAEVPAIFLLNIEQHLANGDITEIAEAAEPVAPAPEVKKETGKQKPDGLSNAGK